MATEELVLDSLMAEGEDGGLPAAELPAATTDEQQTDPGADGGETTDHAGEEDPDKGQGEEKTDGRKNPDAFKKHLAALRANPETAELGKELTHAVGKARGYEEVYPTVREAREVKQLIESAGGREGITGALESHATLQRVDQQLVSADPAAMDEMFKLAPEGMVKLAPAYLERVAKADPQAFQAMLTPHAVQMMNSEGLPGALNKLVDAFNADNKDGMKDMLGRMIQWYKGLMQGAAPKQADPEREKFEREKAEYERSRETEAVQKVFNANLEHSAGLIDKGLAPDIKRLNLGPKAVTALRQNVWKVIQTARSADKTYTNGLQLRFDGRKPKEGALAYLNGYVTTERVQAAIDQVIEEYYGARPKAGTKTAPAVDPTAPKKGPTATQTKQAPAPAAGWTKVATVPSNKEIDYNHPETDTFAGKAVLKDKRKVQWR